MTAFKLFFTRLGLNWRYQWRLFRLVFDWTIILYVLLPALVIFLFVYRSWWLEIPDWATVLPLYVFYFVGYLLAWQGNLRIFTEDADRVFLLKNKALFYGLKRWSFVYSLLFQAFALALVILLFLPFLLGHFQLGWEAISAFYIFLIAVKYIMNYIKFFLRKISGRFLNILATLAVFNVMTVIAGFLFVLWMFGKFTWMNGFSLIMIVVSIGLYLRLLKKPSLFEALLAIDREQKLRGAGMIYQFSMQIEKTPVIRRARPWLFRKSGRIFREPTPVKGFLELFIKFFLRNKVYLSSLFRLIFMLAAAIIIAPPVWLKAVIFIAFIFMVQFWLQSVWDKTFKEHPFMNKYCEGDSFFKARSIMLNVLSLMSIVIMLMIVGSGLYFYRLLLAL